MLMKVWCLFLVENKNQIVTVESLRLLCELSRTDLQSQITTEIKHLSEKFKEKVAYPYEIDSF